MTANSLKHQAKLAAWSERVKECRSSGMSVTAWCRDQGVTTTTYYKWERQVLNEVKIPDTIKSLPAPVFAELPSLRNASEKSIVATVRIGAASLDVYSGADSEIVTALCRALSHAE